jgi:small subunit ribosomal protein S14
MAKTSWIVKCARKPKFKVRAYTRCTMCGRRRARLSEVRHLPHLPAHLAHKGEIPGMRKASW